jgi:hypothetical protein
MTYKRQQRLCATAARQLRRAPDTRAEAATAMSWQEWHARHIVGMEYADFLGRSCIVGDSEHARYISEESHLCHVFQSLHDGGAIAPAALASHPDIVARVAKRLQAATSAGNRRMIDFWSKVTMALAVSEPPAVRRSAPMLGVSD